MNGNNEGVIEGESQDSGVSSIGLSSVVQMASRGGQGDELSLSEAVPPLGIPYGYAFPAPPDTAADVIYV